MTTIHAAEQARLLLTICGLPLLLVVISQAPALLRKGR
jgi:hypothetical protein